MHDSETSSIGEKPSIKSRSPDLMRSSKTNYPVNSQCVWSLVGIQPNSRKGNFAPTLNIILATQWMQLTLNQSIATIEGHSTRHGAQNWSTSDEASRNESIQPSATLRQINVASLEPLNSLASPTSKISFQYMPLYSVEVGNCKIPSVLQFAVHVPAKWHICSECKSKQW